LPNHSRSFDGGRFTDGQKLRGNDPGRMAEKEEKGRYFISHFAAGPEGMIGVYRKIHLGPRRRDLSIRVGVSGLFCC